MTQAFLTRSKGPDIKGTFGVLSYAGRPLCVTCELPWKDNHPQISCIPAGTYRCVRNMSPRFPAGNTWEVQGVTARTGIRLHNANDAAQLEGCIAVGEHFGVLGDVPAILNSTATLERLNGILPDEFDLTIT